ncbi:MAG TPA: DNA polymerase IV [bacterium]|nr:DNA polymerase IV [bacterium]
MSHLIAHIDMNSFFVSCERLLDPSLNGKPVVVGGRKGERGVVASASYEARKYGIKSGMPIMTAEKLCPKALFVPGHHKLYSKYSRKVYVLLRRIAPLVEYASIDEFYLDFTGCEALYGNDPWVMARKVRDSVFERTKLSCSVAIASNKYVAKIAGKTVKPDPAFLGQKVTENTGVVVVPEGQEQAFLAPLPIERLHGAGEKTQPRLKEMRIFKIGDIVSIPLPKLQKSFGQSAGEWLYGAARGLGSAEVHPYHAAKSVGHETTFEKDTADLQQIHQTLAWLSEKGCYRLRRIGKKARTITLKLRYDDFQTITRAHSINPTHDDATVMRTAYELFKDSHTRKRKIRLLGVSLSRFEAVEEGEDWLFPEMGSEKKDKLFKSVDAIKRKYGFHKLEKASSLDPREESHDKKSEMSAFQKPKIQ